MREIQLGGGFATLEVIPLDLGIKALTIWQPWASLLVDGPKKYETRSWATSYRGPIAIHAAKRVPSLTKKIIPPLVLEHIMRHLGGRLLEELPTGSIIGTADLVACHPIDDVFLSSLCEGEERLGDYTIGRYAWEFKNMRALEEPILARGGQRIWNWRPQGGHHGVGNVEPGGSKSQRDR